jgi:hypothetical protein
MKKYAVAILSLFENNNEIFFVEAEDEVQAIKQGLIDFCKDEEIKQSQREWNLELSNSVEELKNELINGELAVTAREIL